MSAPAVTRRPGRPSRGVRVETKLPPELLAEVEALKDIIGSDRSEVIATLVAHAIECRAALAPDVVVIRRWAAEWPTACGVQLGSDGSANVWHVDPADPSGVLDHLHQEILHGAEAEASRRLRAEADRVVSLGYGSWPATGGLVIRCYPDA